MAITLERLSRRLSVEHLWGLAVLVGVFAFLNTHPIRPHDFWWHIQAGREIVTTGHIPAVDTFSFTAAGRPYFYWAFWLMESVLYIAYAAGGAPLVVFTHSAIITAAYALVLWLCWRSSHSWRTAALCSFAAAAIGFNDWNVRTQVIAFSLAALILLAIYEYRWRPHWQWLIIPPLCIVVWVNSHGSFLLGVGLVGIWLVDAIWLILQPALAGTGRLEPKCLTPPALTLLASTLACFVNPQGVGTIAYLGTMAGHPIFRTLAMEWAPPSFHSLHGGIFLASLLLSAALLAVSPRRPTLFQLLTFLSFAVLGLNTSRGIVWFGIVMAPMWAEHLPLVAEQFQHTVARARPPAERQAAPRRAGQAALNYLLAGLILFGALVSLPWFKPMLPLPEAKASLISPETPVEATRFLLQEHPPQPIFNDMMFGSYLIWTAHTEYQVFIDPRIELYPTAVWLHYIEIAWAQYNWEQRLDQYGIRTLMLSTTSQPELVKAASQSPNWRMIYHDPYAAIFTRNS